MIGMNEFAERRQSLMQQVGTEGIVILVAASTVQRNGDNDYPYRQLSDFYYLTGFEEPESVAVFLPKAKGEEFILFNRIRDRKEEIWNGYRAGQEGACQLFGADQAYPIQQLVDKLPELLTGRKQVNYTLGIHNNSFDKILLDAVNKIRSGAQSPPVFIDVMHKIHEMRLFKSPGEIQLMRRAAEISSVAHRKAMITCKPGMNEYQLEAEITYEFQRNGARFCAYAPIIGSGANSCVLHYNNNNQVITDHSIVLVDAGCEYNNYAADVTRTFPANGRFSAEQRAIYDIVLAAQLAGIQSVYPGALWSTAQTKMVEIITQGLLDLGILKGQLEDLIEKKAYFPFYMHQSGHWLGLDVHDVGSYKIDNKWRALQPGMVLTVEPGIYIAADMTGVAKRWHNIGVRIEDDIYVTTKGHEVLSCDAPKTVADIETLMMT